MVELDRHLANTLARLDHSAVLAKWLDLSPIALLLVSPDGRILFANRAFCSLTGFAASELLALTHTDLFDTADPEEDRCGNADAASTDLSFERRYRGKNGASLWLKGLATLERDRDTGDDIFILYQFTDITPQKIAASDENIRPLYERLEIALTASRIGVWEIDFSNDTVEWDDRMRELYGLREGEHCSLGEWRDLLHPDEVARVMEEWDRAFATGSHFESQFQIRQRGGAIRHLHALAHIFRDKEGRPIRAIGANWDVTERQELVEKALAEKERLHVTLRSIGDAVICTDSSGLITFMNPVAEKLTGWSAAEATGRAASDVFNLIEEGSGKPPASPVDQCMRQSRSLTQESGTILLGRTGDAYDIGFSAAPVRTPSEGILGSIIIFNDVTKARADQRKVARSALHDALTGLPNRATFLTRLGDALSEAQEEARSHALCFIDLDRFKLVNDQGGHAAGDALLTHVAKIIALSCSGKDVPARLGGDEFAVLIRDCTESEAEAAANEIIEAVSGIEFRWGSEMFHIGASIGITMIGSASGSLTDVLHEADQACYAAKKSGRGNVCIQKAGETRPKASELPPKWANVH